MRDLLKAAISEYKWPNRIEAAGIGMLAAGLITSTKEYYFGTGPVNWLIPVAVGLGAALAIGARIKMIITEKSKTADRPHLVPSSNSPARQNPTEP